MPHTSRTRPEDGSRQTGGAEIDGRPEPAAAMPAATAGPETTRPGRGGHLTVSPRPGLVGGAAAS
ncbi:hypothetical protein BCD48_30235 [Pseudofrankia sp. BMG5.36]|nr:hypothetical protein BCD48_30235 [Pseudofrankia sp. BMG5.36]